MFLDVSRMHGAHDRVERSYEASGFEATDELRVNGPVSLAFDIYKDGDRYRLVGTASGQVELSCSRCLEPFTAGVEAPFDLRYVPQTDNAGEGEREIEEDDLATAYYRDGVIDLGQLVKEQFYLSLPMKPLCSEACRGLCPQCGANLNQTTCDCPADWEDPRLAGLRTLLDKRN